MNIRSTNIRSVKGPLAWLGVNGSFAKLVAPLAIGVAPVLTACSTSNIPNTDVEDTTENRKVIRFCEEYRHAVEAKDAGKLLKLASAAYHEDGGNMVGDDDMDYDGLKAYLVGPFQKTDNIRYEIRYRRVTFAENKHVLIDYTYAASYRIAGIKTTEWKHTVADNRLELLPDADAFRITAGM